MGRPRGFDEAEVIRRAAALFSVRAYDGTSIDDLVAHLGVHRNSLYKTFGSKRGLYLAALRWSVEHLFTPFADRLAEQAGVRGAIEEALAGPGAENGVDLLLMAAIERAPVDAEVGELVATAFAALDGAFGTAAHAGDDGDSPGVAGAATAVTATLLGLRVRARAGASNDDVLLAGTALARSLTSHG
ncbi:helix-turn-helix domain-containing protein [Streptomyces sp. NPDC026659]|uniref:TetR/AcrR family transcriptional regulator n=1 Tax=Streptomyces sp. NPDC026659 TaxID=3155123 RepID=UPI0033CD4F9E